MKIIVTGGAGFIGSALVRHIINSTQNTVINVDSLTYAGNLESLGDVSNNDRHIFAQVDICDADAIERVFAEHKPDLVMHLAAESHVDRSILGPTAFVETNVNGTLAMLEAIRDEDHRLSGPPLRYLSKLRLPCRFQHRLHTASRTHRLPPARRRR